MKTRSLILIYSSGFLLQHIFQSISLLNNITPHIIFVMSMVFTSLSKNESAIFVCMTIFALLYDISFSIFTGSTAIIVLAVSTLIFFLKGKINFENYLVRTICWFIANIIYVLGQYLFTMILETHFNLLSSSLEIFVFILSNMCAAWIIYYIFSKSIFRDNKERYYG